MAICKFFLNGTCKFGDRCFNEHRKPDRQGSSDNAYHNSSDQDRGYPRGGGRGHNAYNAGYGGDRGHGGGHGHGGSSGGGGGYGGNRNSRGGGGNNYYGNYGGGHRGGGDSNYNAGYSGGGYGGGHGDSDYNARYGGNRNSRGGGNNYNSNYGGNKTSSGRNANQYDSTDTGNHNRYSALSHQPDLEPVSFHQKPRGRTASSSSHNTPDQNVERIRKDLTEWTTSGQWPLSCYAAFANEPCLGGLEDISPEELRHEAYKSNATGNPSQYTQSLQQLIHSCTQKKRELANMSEAALQQEMVRAATATTSSTTTLGIFGNMQSSAPMVSNEKPTSLFGNSSSTTTSQPGGLFGSSLQSMSTTESFTSPSLPAASGSSGPFSSSSGPFSSSSGTSQGTPSSAIGNMQSKPSSTPTTNSAPAPQQTVVLTLRCSEQDMKAFRQDHFVLGAIPECPPPPELC